MSQMLKIHVFCRKQTLFSLSGITKPKHIQFITHKKTKLTNQLIVLAPANLLSQEEFSLMQSQRTTILLVLMTCSPLYKCWEHISSKLHHTKCLRQRTWSFSWQWKCLQACVNCVCMCESWLLNILHFLGILVEETPQMLLVWLHISELQFSTCLLGAQIDVSSSFHPPYTQLIELFQLINHLQYHFCCFLCCHLNMHNIVSWFLKNLNFTTKICCLACSGHSKYTQSTHVRLGAMMPAVVYLYTLLKSILVGQGEKWGLMNGKNDI